MQVAIIAQMVLASPTFLGLLSDLHIRLCHPTSIQPVLSRLQGHMIVSRPAEQLIVAALGSINV